MSGRNGENFRLSQVVSGFQSFGDRLSLTQLFGLGWDVAAPLALSKSEKWHVVIEPFLGIR